MYYPMRTFNFGNFRFLKKLPVFRHQLRVILELL